jgi:hypothetical protein
MGGLLAGLWQFQALQAEEKFADFFAPELSYYIQLGTQFILQRIEFKMVFSIKIKFS